VSPTAVVTGANQGLGYAAVAQLARRLGTSADVYLTGRNPRRVSAAVAALRLDGLSVHNAHLDVRDEDGPLRLAQMLHTRHGTVDVVMSNAAARLSPDLRDSDQIEEFVDTNNLGTTRMMRAFDPVMAPSGRFVVVASSFGTLASVPAALHPMFDSPALTLDAIDDLMRHYTQLVISGRAAAAGWPGWINLPSKVAQVAATRVFAKTSTLTSPGATGLVVAACPGLVDTDASRPWFRDRTSAQSPDVAAKAVVDLALGPAAADLQGQLVQHGRVLAWDR